MALFRGIRWLFPAMLFTTLLQNSHDLTRLLTEGTLTLYRYDGPIIYKVLKDVIYLLIITAIIIRAKRTKCSPLTDYASAFILLILAMVVLSTFANGLLAGLIGLRWILPLILFLLMRDWSAALDRIAAAKWLVIGLVGCIAMQAYELFYMPPVFGEIFAGLPARTPGFFVAPNSAAFFTCASAACVMVFTPTNMKLKIVVVAFAILSSALTQSGTGMVTALLLGLHLACGHNRKLFWSIMIGAVALILPNLNFLTMREDYLELSGGGRLDAFLNIARNSVISVTHFGLYTNAANLQSSNPEDQIAPDSLLASWAGNFGLFAGLAALLCGLFIRYRMRVIDWGHAMPCVLVFSVFSMTTIVFEAFPMNLFLALGIWTTRQKISAAD